MVLEISVPSRLSLTSPGASLVRRSVVRWRDHMFPTWSVTLQCLPGPSDGQVRSDATLLPDTIYSAPAGEHPRTLPLKAKF